MQSLWMLPAGLCFAVMGVFVKLGAQYFSTAELVLYRSLFSIVAIYAVMRHRGVEVRTTRIGMHFRRGVTGFFSMLLFFYAVAELPLATAATLGYTSPLFMALLLVWFTRERPATALRGTIALGFAGVLLLLKPTLSADQLWAGLVGLASGGVSALTYYNVRELVRAHEPEYRVVFYYAVFACLCALIWMIPSGWHRLTPDSIGLMAGVAVMGTLGQVFLTRAYGQGKTMVTATLSYTGVVFSSVFGVWIWGDLLPWTSWLAIAMIVGSGVVAVQMNPSDGGVRVGESHENGRR